MEREVRKVPADWQHPKDECGNFIPMYYESYAEMAAEFMAFANEKGLQRAIDFYGAPPEEHQYMPDWPLEQRTHYMMYEDTSEGTPISPAFATPEELARWLADTGASAFGSDTASYEAWLRVARGGYACSAVITNGVMQSGVEGLAGETP